MKLYEIMNMRGAFNVLSNEKLCHPWPFKIAVNAKKIEPFVAAYQSASVEIATKYAVKDDEGNPKRDINNNIVWIDQRSAEIELLALNETDEVLELSKVPLDAVEKESFSWPILAALMPMIQSE